MFRSMAMTLIVLAMPLVLVGQAKGEPKKLNNEELTALYEGGFTIEHEKGWKMVVSGDGTMLFEGGVTDTGTWRIDGDQACSRWRKLRSGAERCFPIEIDGDSYIWADSDGKKDRARLTR